MILTHKKGTFSINLGVKKGTFSDFEGLLSVHFPHPFLQIPLR